MNKSMGRIFRSIMYVTVSTVVLAGAANAQFMRMSPEERAKVLKDSLALDSSQVTKVTAIYKESQDAMSKAFQENQGDREAMRTTMTDLGKKTDEKIKAVLTDTQKKKYEEMVKNRPMRGGMRRPGN